jgi:hypothetical protein
MSVGSHGVAGELVTEINDILYGCYAILHCCKQLLFNAIPSVITSWRELHFARWAYDDDDAMKCDPLRMRDFIVNNHQVA